MFSGANGVQHCNPKGRSGLKRSSLRACRSREYKCMNPDQLIHVPNSDDRKSSLQKTKKNACVLLICTHGSVPEVFIMGCTMNAWVDAIPTRTEAAVNFMVKDENQICD